MTTPQPGTITPAPFNLAALVQPLPPVTFPDGTTHQLVWSAAAVEQFRHIKEFVATRREGAIDDFEAGRLVDACIVLVLPTASPDTLASISERYDLKMSLLVAASGNADRVLEKLAPKTHGEAVSTPLSPPDTTSAP